MSIRKCNITAFILLRVMNVGAEPNFKECLCKYKIPTRKERSLLDRYSVLNIGSFFI